MALAQTVHPAWDRLKEAAQKLHARNCYQTLGKTLDAPSAFVLCWTSDGCETEKERTRDTGGTGTAIVLAHRRGIPVFNLKRANAVSRLQTLLDSSEFGVKLPHLEVPDTSNPQASLF